MQVIKRMAKLNDIEKLNIAISVIFTINLFIRSTLLGILFFFLWEFLLYKLYVKQRKEKKYLFSYFFLTALVAVICLQAWLMINLYQSII